jgi:hypothetical protein
MHIIGRFFDGQDTGEDDGFLNLLSITFCPMGIKSDSSWGLQNKLNPQESSIFC